MNPILENIILGFALVVAIGFLVKKFFIPKRIKKSCGPDDCGCH